MNTIIAYIISDMGIIVCELLGIMVTLIICIKLSGKIKAMEEIKEELEIGKRYSKLDDSIKNTMRRKV